VEKINLKSARSLPPEHAFVQSIPPRREVSSIASYFAFLFGVLALAAISSPAQTVHPTEYQVKAAYLYNFGKFVRWQSDRVANSGPLEICVLGKDPFGMVLDSTVAGDSIDGRKITVGRVSSVQQAAPCSILFISSSEDKQLSSILAAAADLGLLTVSDMANFAERGGAVGFVTQQERIRFEVNRDAAQRSHLVLSSELLKVASKVIGKGGPQN